MTIPTPEPEPKPNPVPGEPPTPEPEPGLPPGEPPLPHPGDPIPAQNGIGLLDPRIMPPDEHAPILAIPPAPPTRKQPCKVPS
jgi:hypothetical protein